MSIFEYQHLILSSYQQSNLKANQSNIFIWESKYLLFPSEYQSIQPFCLYTYLFIYLIYLSAFHYEANQLFCCSIFYFLAYICRFHNKVAHLQICDQNILEKFNKITRRQTHTCSLLSNNRP